MHIYFRCISGYAYIVYIANAVVITCEAYSTRLSISGCRYVEHTQSEACAKLMQHTAQLTCRALLSGEIVANASEAVWKQVGR